MTQHALVKGIAVYFYFNPYRCEGGARLAPPACVEKVKRF
jgi:hypothetical protein